MTSCAIEFNIVDLYNDREDSDVQIELNSGEMIHAHKIILKRGSDMCRRLFGNKMLESKTGVIKFPDHPDDVVVALVKFLYGVEIIPRTMQFCDWADLFQFANYLQVVALINFLDLNYPTDSPLSELIELAWTMDRPVLMRNSVIIFFKLYRSKSEYSTREDINGLMNQIASIEFDAYTQFRNAWINSGCDQCLLFELDCHYTATNCDTLAEKMEMLNMFIPDIEFDKLYDCELAACKELPMLSEIPAIRHLISLINGKGEKVWGTGRERGMPDSRSLMYGNGKISSRDPRANLVAPIDRVFDEARFSARMDGDILNLLDI
jgi:hypothetical protein